MESKNGSKRLQASRREGLRSNVALSAPVASEITMRVGFVTMIMMRGTAHILDKKGAFLVGAFNDGEEFYMERCRKDSRNSSV